MLWQLRIEGLEGTLPSKLGQLTTLTELYLGSNAFNGDHPIPIGRSPKKSKRWTYH
jgi:hypothetical protein